MFKIKQIKEGTKKTYIFVKFKNKTCEFEKRQKARQYIRNHFTYGTQLQIIHPDGTVEQFKWTTFL